MVLKLEHVSELPGGLALSFLGCAFRVLYTVAREWSLSLCISNKFPDDIDAVVWDSHFQNHYSTLS
jgi:hypothetical protein